MIVLSVPPAFYHFVRFGFAALCGYLPAYLLLNSWQKGGVFILAGILLLPLPITLALHLLHVLPFKIHFLFQCGCLGCTSASFFFLAKRLGWMKFLSA